MAANRYALTIRVPASALQPDNAQWTNRIQIRSESSNRVYIISQNKAKRHWGCSCPGWCNRRKCKHLDALNLPAFEKAHEVQIEAVR
jgi:hypothetical protein